MFRRFGSEMILAQAPTTIGREATEAQTAHRERFKLAALYGRVVMADPVKKSVYESRARSKNIPIFALCVGDYLTPPEVKDIDLTGYTGKAGETIRITAVDDFEVIDVDVAITDASEQLVEAGPAMRDPATGGWVYTTSIDVPAGERVSVEVTATNRPGHTSSRVQLAA